MSGLPQISILRHVRRILRCMTGKVPSNCSAIDAWSMSTEYLISYSSLSLSLSTRNAQAISIGVTYYRLGETVLMRRSVL